MSMYEVFSKFRINLIVCETSSPELERYINHNADILLMRNEIVISAAIVLNEQVLLFPDCMTNLTLNQLKRYKAAAQFLCNVLVN